VQFTRATLAIGHVRTAYGVTALPCWVGVIVPMVEATYKSVKIELKITQNEDGAWVTRCSLKWPDISTEHFAGKYTLATERPAHASALEQVRQYIDRRESHKSQLTDG
jgi:hypothetical protein